MCQINYDVYAIKHMTGLINATPKTGKRIDCPGNLYLMKY